MPLQIGFESLRIGLSFVTGAKLSRRDHYFGVRDTHFPLVLVKMEDF
jgi:hypothetical protein